MNALISVSFQHSRNSGDSFCTSVFKHSKLRIHFFLNWNARPIRGHFSFSGSITISGITNTDQMGSQSAGTTAKLKYWELCLSTSTLVPAFTKRFQPQSYFQILLYFPQFNSVKKTTQSTMTIHCGYCVVRYSNLGSFSWKRSIF